MKEWQYKDMNRNYWKVILNKRLMKGEDQDYIAVKDDADLQWCYQVFVSDSGEDPYFYLVYSGVIIGQYNIVPSLQDIMKDFAAAMVTISIGFAISGFENR
jgi:hypothetical protein